MAAAIAVAAVTVAATACSATGATAPTRSGSVARVVPGAGPGFPIVDTAATPRGWLPVVSGDAQLSVPADWGLVSDGESACLDTPGAVILDNGSWCPTGTATMGPPSPVTVSLRSVGPQSSAELDPPSRVIRGIPVYAPGLAPVYAVPALHATVDLSGPVPPAVLTSLTYSPRAVVLAPGPRPRVPSRWRWVRFEGFGFAVPPTWVVDRVGSPTGCVFPPPVANRVTVATGPPSAMSCTARLPDLRSAQPVPAMEIVDQGSPNGAAPGRPACPGLRRSGGLNVCVDTSATGSTLDATMWTGHSTVTVLLGLWGDGTEARTIFRSFSPGR
jgi:hypothetical protein